MKKPEVSVVIPVYNTGIILQETIDSVLSQSFTGFELIIVDDGSTDQVTLDILKKQEDERIRIIHQVNSGVAAARNRGIADAKGEYIAFLDHDDLFLKDKLFEFKKSMANVPSAALVFSGIVPLGESKSQLVVLPVVDNPDFLTLLNQNLIYSTSCMMVRRAFLEKYRILFDPECVPCDDWDFYLQCALHGDIRYVQTPLTEYRFHDSNQSRDQIKMYLAGIRTAGKYRKSISDIHEISGIPRLCLLRAANNALSEHHYGIAFQYFGKREFQKALQHGMKAFFYRPFSAKVPLFIWKKVGRKFFA